MADEIIGSVGVEVRADYSDLGADFDKAVALAVQAGHTLAESITIAMQQAADGSTAAFGQIGDSAAHAAEQLSLFGTAEEQIPFADATGQLNLFTTALDDFTNTERKATEETSQTVSAFQRFDTAIDNMMDRLNNSEGFHHFAEGVGEFIAHPLQTAGSAATNFIETIGPIGTVALGVAAGLAEIAHEAFHLVEAFGEAAHETQNLAFRLNLTFEQTRELQDMATLAGVSIDRLAMVSFKFAQALEDADGAGKKTADALKAIGVAGQTSGDLLLGFLQKLAEIPDATERIDIAHRVLGRSSQQIVPLIARYDELKAAIEKLGPVLDHDMAEALERSHLKVNELSIAWGRFKEQVAVALAPPLTNFLDQLTEAITRLQLLARSVNEGKVGVGGFAVTALAAFTSAAKATTIFWEETKKSGEELGKTKKATEDHAAALAKLDPTVKAVIDQEAALQEKVKAAQAAYDTLSEALRTHTALSTGYVVTQKDVDRALANLTAAQAAAATATQLHADKTHGHLLALREMQPAIQVLVATVKDWEAGYKKLTEDTVAFNKQFGVTITQQDLAAIRFAAATLAVENFGDTIDNTVAKAPGLDFEKPLKKAMPAFDAIIAQLNKMAMATDGNAEDVERLEGALKHFGIVSTQQLETNVDLSQQAYDDILDTASTDYQLIDLAAAKLTLDQIELAHRQNRMSQDEYEDLKQATIAKIKEIEGTEKLSLDHRKSAQQKFTDEIIQINHRTFDDLERGLARSIVQLKGFGDLWKQLWQKLAEDLLTIMFKVLLDPLERRLTDLLKRIPLPGGGTGPGAPTTPGTPSQTPGAGGAAGAGAGALGIANLVTGAITAISSVVGNFQMAHMSSDLQKIEESTRYVKIYTGEQADSLLATAHTDRDTLLGILAALQGVVKITLDGKISNDEANKLVDTLINGSLNFYMRSFNVLNELLQADTSGFAQVVGMLHAIEKALNPPLWKSLLGNVIGGIFGSVGSAFGGVISGIGGAIGNFIGGIFGGGSSKHTQDLIEENTRYINILTYQNLPTIAVNSVLHTQQLDAIGVKLGQLDTLAINSVMQTDCLTTIRDTLLKMGNSIQTAPGTAKASENQAVTVVMHQPRIGRLTSASEVSQIFQEGIQQAKEAGAFRFGVFPAV